MKFSEALEQIDKGRVVARRSSSWFAKNWGVGACRWYDGPRLQRVKNDQWHAPFVPTNADIFADDWEIVDVSPPGPSFS